jgi:ribosome-binding factor A
MTDPARARRLADRIKVLVAELLERRIKDPRLGFVTVTDARLTTDLRDATVFYTVYGDASAHAGTAAALESARGVLRSEVGRHLGLRHTPTLAFVTDPLPDTAAHIDELLAAARVADAELARTRAGASPAGADNPYREPRPDEE